MEFIDKHPELAKLLGLPCLGLGTQIMHAIFSQSDRAVPLNAQGIAEMVMHDQRLMGQVIMGFAGIVSQLSVFVHVCVFPRTFERLHRYLPNGNLIPYVEMYYSENPKVELSS